MSFFKWLGEKNAPFFKFERDLFEAAASAAIAGALTLSFDTATPKEVTFVALQAAINGVISAARRYLVAASMADTSSSTSTSNTAK